MASTEEVAPIMSTTEELTNHQLGATAGGGSPTTTAGSVSPRKASRSAAGITTSTKGSRSTRESKRNKENVQPEKKKKVSSKHATTNEQIPAAASEENDPPTTGQEQTAVDQHPATPSAGRADESQIQEEDQQDQEGGGTKSDAPKQEVEQSAQLAPSTQGSLSTMRNKSSKVKSPTKQLSIETAQIKAKIAALISKSFTGSAYEVFAGTTTDSLESCFPSVSPSEGLKSGSEVIPGSEGLPVVLNKMDLTTSSEDVKDIPNLQEYLRDVTLAGAFIGSSEILEECLKKGADLSMADSSGRNIFHVLATTGNTPLLRKVLRRLEKTHSTTAIANTKGDLSQRSTTKKTRRLPMEVSSSFSDVINAADKRGWTPLLVAVCRNNVDAAEALLSYPQLNLECWLAHSCPPSQHSGDCKSCPIHFAAIQGSANLVKRLLVCGVSIDLRDTMGRNIFHYAAALKDKNLSVDFLRSLQDEPQFDKSLLLTTDSHGRSPIFIALAWGNLAFIEAALKLVLANRAAATAQQSVPIEISPPQNDENTSDAGPAPDKDTDESRAQQVTLTSLTLKPDVFALSAVQIAFLRRHYHVIFWLSQMWSILRVKDGLEPDLPTFVDALRSSVAPRLAVPYEEASDAPPLSPSRILISLLADQTFFNKPLEKDLSALEMSTFRVLQTALSHERFPPIHPTKLMRAVRSAGPELCLRCLNRALEIEREGGLVVGTRRFTNEGAFFHYLKEQMEKEMTHANATFNWRFIHVEEHYAKQGAKERRRSASVTSQLSQSEAYSVPLNTSPSPGTASRGGARRQIVPQPTNRTNAARSSSLTEPRAARFAAATRSMMARGPDANFASPRAGSTSGTAIQPRTTPGQPVNRSVVGRSGPAPSPVTRSVMGESWESKPRTSPNLSRSAVVPPRSNIGGGGGGVANSQRFAAPTFSTLQNSRGPSSQSPILGRSQVRVPRGNRGPQMVERRPPGNVTKTGARHMPPPVPTSGQGRPVFPQQASSLESDARDIEPAGSKSMEASEQMEHDRRSSLVDDEEEEDISFEDQDF